MRQNYVKITIIVVILICICAMYYTADLRRDQSILEKLVAEITLPLSGLAHRVRTGITGFFSGLKSYREYVLENEELRLENAELRRELALMQHHLRENEALRTALSLPLIQEQTMLAAEVIARSPDEWWSQVTINKGSRAGIEPGSPVLDKYGRVVGRVWAASWHSAKVVLCVDPRITVGGRIKRTGGLVLVEGGHPEYPQGLRIKPLDRHMDIVEGDVVLTSGYSQHFPSDLPLCRIDKVVLDDYHVPTLGFAEPVADLMQLDLVYVLSWEMEDEQ
ncbi:MAG: rod shape-determining protein MreC [Limnochordia bacterium]|jgi:rod shape-determining protein MreC|nr:rod shape-determining protein MreC [Limnochordia bacterium]